MYGIDESSPTTTHNDFNVRTLWTESLRSDVCLVVLIASLNPVAAMFVLDVDWPVTKMPIAAALRVPF